MAKKRSNRSKQQKRQAASARRNERRAAQQRRDELQQVPDIPAGPLSPGDRMNLILGELGRRLDAYPPAARAVALVIDFLLGGLVALGPAVFALNRAGGESLRGLEDLRTAGLGMGAIAVVLAACLLLSFAYYVLVPYKLLPGRTLGKYLTHLEIVMMDGTPATMGALSARWAFMTVFETFCTFASTLLTQYVAMLGGETLGNVYNLVGAAATAISIWLVYKNAPTRRALHDLVAGTWVYTNS